MKPGGLRIWDESRNLGDYSFQFEGRVESKSLGWVVRAPNHNNYYAAKLAIPDRGGAARPEIIRFSVIQGQESRRQQMVVKQQALAQRQQPMQQQRQAFAGGGGRGQGGGGGQGGQDRGQGRNDR